MTTASHESIALLLRELAASDDGWTVAAVAPDPVVRAWRVDYARAGEHLSLRIEPAEHAGPAFRRVGPCACSYYPPPAALAEEAARLTAALAGRIERRLATAGLPEGFWRPVWAGRGRAAAELRFGRACDEDCPFCNTPPAHPELLTDFASVAARLAALRAAGVRNLTLTGREPTLEPWLPDVVARAAALGFRRVTLQTNGRRLGTGDLAARLARAGLGRVTISLHARDGTLARRLTGRPDSASAALQGCRCALAAGLELEVNVVLTALNDGELPALLGLVKGLSAAPAGRWTATSGRPEPDTGHRTPDTGGARPVRVILSVVAPTGAAAGRPDLWPTYAQVRAALRPATTAARRLGLALSVPARCGVPPCLVPQEARAACREALGETPGAADQKTLLPACEVCALRSHCPGFWAAYLDRAPIDVVGLTATEAAALLEGTEEERP